MVDGNKNFLKVKKEKARIFIIFYAIEYSSGYVHHSMLC